MNPIYAARHYDPKNYAATVKDQDFDTPEEAKAAVAVAGQGQVIKFARYDNGFGGVKYNSIWMEVYRDGVWTKPNIHC